MRETGLDLTSFIVTRESDGVLLLVMQGVKCGRLELLTVVDPRDYEED